VSPAIPIKAPTAFFVGSTSDVITTDNTNKVMRWSFNAGQWSSREIYHGENVVFYAEPDASGDRLIILEQITLDNLGAGAVYSVKARQTWFELGSGNFFMATFNTDTNVGLFSPSGDVRGGWTRVSFPIIPLSKLEALCGGEPFAALPPGKTG
jgi:hypothetical protein